MKLEHTESVYKAVKSRRDSVKNAFVRFQDRLKYFMNRHPEIPFRGSERGFRLKGSGGKPKLSLNFNLYDERNLIHESDIEAHGIPDDCIDKITVYKLDKEKLRQHMDPSVGLEAVFDGNEQILAAASWGRLTKAKSLVVD